jgi:hypothetical protein
VLVTAIHVFSAPPAAVDDRHASGYDAVGCFSSDIHCLKPVGE